ncbi:uncharacterized protein BJ171DRAFT_623613, partial [Polychytrium aggregatum]
VLVTPEQFAQIFADDIDSPLSQQFVPLISQSIRQQCQSYLEEDSSPGMGQNPPAPVHPFPEGPTMSLEDIRIIIKLDVNVGTFHLHDQFEWPLFAPNAPSPEEFAHQLSLDLGFPQEYISVIAHEIRQQLCLARINFEESAHVGPVVGAAPAATGPVPGITPPHLSVLGPQGSALNASYQSEHIQEGDWIQSESSEKGGREKSKRKRNRQGASYSSQSLNLSGNPSHSGMSQNAASIHWQHGGPAGGTSNSSSGSNSRTMMPPSHPSRIPYRNYTPTAEEQATFSQFAYGAGGVYLGGPQTPTQSQTQAQTPTQSHHPNPYQNQLQLPFQSTHYSSQFGGANVPQQQQQQQQQQHPAHLSMHFANSGPGSSCSTDNQGSGSTIGAHMQHNHMSSASQKKEKRKQRDPPIIDTELVAKQVELMQQSADLLNNPGGGELINTANGNIIDLSDSRGISPPKKHRGFGASANMFNADGSIDVGEFRLVWRCSWCLLSGRYTPTLRKGPLGSKTLCNACGIWYSKHGSLPQDRYQENADCV